MGQVWLWAIVCRPPVCYNSHSSISKSSLLAMHIAGQPSPKHNYTSQLPLQPHVAMWLDSSQWDVGGSIIWDCLEGCFKGLIHLGRASFCPCAFPPSSILQRAPAAVLDHEVALRKKPQGRREEQKDRSLSPWWHHGAAILVLHGQHVVLDIRERETSVLCKPPHMLLLLYAAEPNRICVLTCGNTQQILDE